MTGHTLIAADRRPDDIRDGSTAPTAIELIAKLTSGNMIRLGYAEDGQVRLTKSFSEDFYRRALEDWAWLPLLGKRPCLAPLFEDVFLEDGSGIWMLDILEGSLSHVFPDRQQMAAVLNTGEGRDRYLLGGLALAAERRLGLVPGADQVLAWKVPPVLGAPTAIENLQLMDFEAYLSIQGQLHQQLKDLPPGTKITGFTVGGEGP